MRRAGVLCQRACEEIRSLIIDAGSKDVVVAPTLPGSRGVVSRRDDAYNLQDAGRVEGAWPRSALPASGGP